MNKLTYLQIIFILFFTTSYSKISNINSRPISHKTQKIDLSMASPAVTNNSKNTANLYFSDINVFGTWGGVCTCPDGAKYHVADQSNACHSLACIDGTSSRCYDSAENNWRHMGVICGGKKAEPKKLAAASTKEDKPAKGGDTAAKGGDTPAKGKDTGPVKTTIHTNIVNITKNVTISWDRKTVCQFDRKLSRDNQVHCKKMTWCGNTKTNMDVFTCIDWDSKGEALNKFQFIGCDEKVGINQCASLVGANCVKKNGVFDTRSLQSNRLYKCTEDSRPDYQVEYDTCRYDNSLGIAKCCESHTSMNKTCRHFMLSNNDIKRDLITRFPDFNLDDITSSTSFA